MRPLGIPPGHVALLDDRDRMLYCGDVYSTLGGVATSARVYPRCPLALFSWHRPIELESARALRALEPARLAPGHGKVVESPLEAMDRAIARGCQPPGAGRISITAVKPAPLQ